MGGIRTAIELQDNFSGVLYNVCGAVNLAISSMLDMQDTMSSGVDMSSLDGAREQINSAAAALEAMNESIRNMPSPQIQVPDQETVHWQSDSLPVFDGSGVERYRQEIQSANAMLQQLSNTQDGISRQALHMDLLPPEAFQDINSLSVRIDHLRDRIQAISENPVNMGTEAVNAGLEQLRSQLDMAVRQQEELNTAMESGDLSTVNSAYLRLSQTVSSTERYIRDNTDEQGRFNQQIRDGTSSADNLINAIKGIAAAYLSIRGIGETIAFSDEIAQTVSRLDLMNDGAQTTQQLFDKIYDSAKETHSSVLATADAIAKMGNNAGSAFANNEELIAFMEQINKQFVIGGASAQEQQNALVQLSQAMSAGALRGEELNSILDAAPGIARAIEQSMGWAEGSIKSYAEQGMVTAETVKTSMLNMAEQTDNDFESMSVTFSQVLTDIQDDAIIAFQPVLQSLNDIANSEAFQSLADTAVQGLTMLANCEALQKFVGEIEHMLDTLNQSGAFQGLVNGAVFAFELLLNVASVTVDFLVNLVGLLTENWSMVAPVIYGVAAALLLYLTYLGITNAVGLVSKAIKMGMVIAEYAHAAATGTAVAATTAETAAQMGLNTAFLSCPIVWIILLIIALVAAIYTVCSAIAKVTGAASSGFGIILGCVFVANAAFTNFGMLVANIALGIWEALKALCDNMVTAFQNAIVSVKSWFYSLLSTALTTIAGICEALNDLPFVSFDYSGIEAAANDYAAKSAEEAESKMDYKDVSAAFDKGYDTYNAFGENWASDAFKKGTAAGDALAEKVSNIFSGIGKDYKNMNPMNTSTGINQSSNSGAGMGGNANQAAQTAANTGQTAANTAAIADSLDVSNEQLKYLRDVAERDTINRFTTASIKVEMTNNNNVSSKMDLDGIVDSLTLAVEDAMSKSASGVHH